MTLECRCFACGCDIKGGQFKCPQCGVSFTAPSCPHCLQPVTKTPSPSNQLSTLCWNTDWQNRCDQCGHEFSCDVKFVGGHPRTFFEIQRLLEEHPYQDLETMLCPYVQLQMVGGESVYMEYDSCDHQPTIEITIRRHQSGNCGSPESQLDRETRVVLTVLECQELIRQLQGPLAVLMQRQPWWIDTT